MRNAMKGGGAGLVLLLGLAAAAHAAPAGGPGGSGYLDSISSDFATATSGWMTTAQGYAFKIFTALAAMDLSWWGIKQVLKKNDLADFVAGAALKIASIGFFYTVLAFAPTWMPLIPQSFMTMGGAIGGSAAASTPSGVMSMAFAVVDQLYTVYNSAPGGMFHIGSNLFLAIVIAVTSLFALAGFGLVALQLLMTLVEMYLVGGAGLVMLGFTGSGLTSSFGEKYIGYLVSVGVKLLTIYAIIGLGANLIANEMSYISSYIGSPSGTMPPTDLLSVGVSMMLYGVIGIQVPGLAGSMMNGSPSMTLGNVAGGAAAIMAPAAAGVMGAGAAGAAAVGGYAKAMQGLENLAARVGAGAVSSASPAGGIGGTDKLAQLGSITGATGRSGPTGAIVGSQSGTSAARQAAGGVASGSGSVSGAVSRAAQVTTAMMERRGAASPGAVPPGGSSVVAAQTGTPARQVAQGGAAPSPSAVAPVGANGAVDALGAPADPAGAAKNFEGRDPADLLKGAAGAMKDSAGKLHDFAKHDLNRFEGSGGGGIQIRLGHHEGH
ncbi:p-type conjugative transfer protein TrbL [Burkholderiales bacterium GJ-E10]|nr:p-type conjugative transfer protein TrbL [Burkholderiales bacterium GJ-E10]